MIWLGRYSAGGGARREQ